MHYHLIAPLIIVRKQDHAFTYHYDHILPVGSLVRIGVGVKTTTGVVVQNKLAKPSFTTKPVQELLTETPWPRPLLRLAEWMSAYYATHFANVLQTMLPSGLHKTRRTGKTLPPPAVRAPGLKHLTTEQIAAITAISNNTNGTILLHGVTGSGKTQVYIDSVKSVHAKGASAIILVPEISLTPQLVAEFTNHFPRVLVTHSGMTEAQRHQTWLTALQATEPLVVIGPRSALFMPLAQVGLIVVDEAHEPSYKQEQSPRYLASRAASILAKLHSATLVLGTATPNVTDYYLAEQTNSSIVRLTRTARTVTPPTLELVDNTRKDFFREHRYLSDPLLLAMRRALASGEQSLLFHNRRGTAPSTLCESCGWSALCSHCFVPYTFHADKHQLLCHLCGRLAPVPPTCPECGNPDIVFKGLGTKSIEQELHKLFKNATVARFDADNTAEQTLHARYQELYDGAIDIAVGTQILAKGLDLPKLTVVGVLQADSGLGLPDYQSEERVYQLLSQVAGRVGRGEKSSSIIIQTYQPSHPAIAMALQSTYTDFYRHTLTQRQKADFPPFTHLLKLTCSHKTERGAIQSASRLASQLRQQPDIQVLGPTPAFYERLGDHYRWQLLVKSRKRDRLTTILATLPSGWQGDIDPGNLL